jgi:hypothetical protein
VAVDNRHDFHAFSALCGSDIRAAAFGHHKRSRAGRASQSTLLHSNEEAWQAQLAAYPEHKHLLGPPPS